VRLAGQGGVERLQAPGRAQQQPGAGGREGIRTLGLLVANEEKSKLRLGATVT